MTRRAISAPFLAAALLALLSAVPVHAQSHRGGLTFVAGGSTHGDLTPGLTDPTVFEAGWVAGVQAEAWLWSGRTGLRLNTLFTRRALEDGGEYAVASGGLNLLIRPLPPRPGRRLAPYLAIGGGATRYAAAEGAPPLADGLYGADPVTRLHALAGLGVDVTVAPRVGIRVELADQIVFPSVGTSPPADGVPSAHNGVLTAGVQLRLGRLPTAPSVAGPVPQRPERAPRTPGADLEPEPTPEPEPAPEPEPTPEPEPAPEAVPTPAAGPVLYTVQIGSFIEPATAERWAEALRRRGIPVWLRDVEIQGQRVNRVRVGAVPTETQALRLADILRRDYGWELSIDRVEPEDAYPEGAVEATRTFLQGG